MKIFGANPKTNLWGIITLVATILNAILGVHNGHGIDVPTTVTGVGISAGLFSAADGKK